MRSLDIFSTQKVRYKGRYDFESIYQAIYDFLEGKRYEVRETDYTYDGNNDKLTVEIEARKEVNALIRRRVELEVEGFDYDERRVKQGGEVKEVVDGRLIITLTGYADIDYRGIFTGHAWWEGLGDIVYRTIRKRWFKKYFGPNYFAPIYKDCAKLRGTINSELDRMK